jgi:hypothetical protein
VRAVVVHDDMDIEISGHVALDLVEELAKLLRPVPGQLRVNARTVLELGSELISSDIIAFYELIKNAFDAESRTGADIRFRIAMRRNDYLRIRDKAQLLGVQKVSKVERAEQLQDLARQVAAKLDTSVMRASISLRKTQAVSRLRKWDADDCAANIDIVNASIKSGSLTGHETLRTERQSRIDKRIADSETKLQTTLGSQKR